MGWPPANFPRSAFTTEGHPVYGGTGYEEVPKDILGVDVAGNPGDQFIVQGCSTVGSDYNGMTAGYCIGRGYGGGIQQIKNQYGEIVAYAGCCNQDSTVLNTSMCMALPSYTKSAYIKLPRLDGIQSCASEGYMPIRTATECDAAARALGLSDQTSQPVQPTVMDKLGQGPYGCFWQVPTPSDSGNSLYLNTYVGSKAPSNVNQYGFDWNDQQNQFDANFGRQPVCYRHKPRKLRVSGFCESQSSFNTYWREAGLTKNGAPYFTNDQAQMLYYDPNCEGVRFDIGGKGGFGFQEGIGRWVFQSNGSLVDVSRYSRLDGGQCSYHGRFDSLSAGMPPLGYNQWKIYCGSTSGYVEHPILIEKEADSEQGSSQFNYMFYPDSLTESAKIIETEQSYLEFKYIDTGSQNTKWAASIAWPMFQEPLDVESPSTSEYLNSPSMVIALPSNHNHVVVVTDDGDTLTKRKQAFSFHHDNTLVPDAQPSTFVTAAATVVDKKKYPTLKPLVIGLPYNAQGIAVVRPSDPDGYAVIKSHASLHTHSNMWSSSAVVLRIDDTQQVAFFYSEVVGMPDSSAKILHVNSAKILEQVATTDPPTTPTTANSYGFQTIDLPHGHFPWGSPHWGSALSEGQNGAMGTELWKTTAWIGEPLLTHTKTLGALRDGMASLGKAAAKVVGFPYDGKGTIIFDCKTQSVEHIYWPYPDPIQPYTPHLFKTIAVARYHYGTIPYAVVGLPYSAGRIVQLIFDHEGRAHQTYVEDPGLVGSQMWDTSVAVETKVIGLPFSAGKVVVYNTHGGLIEYVNDARLISQKWSTSSVVGNRVIGFPNQGGMQSDGSTSGALVNYDIGTKQIIFQPDVRLGTTQTEMFLTSAVIHHWKVVGIPYNAPSTNAGVLHQEHCQYKEQSSASNGYATGQGCDVATLKSPGSQGRTIASGSEGRTIVTPGTVCRLTPLVPLKSCRGPSTCRLGYFDGGRPAECWDNPARNNDGPQRTVYASDYVRGDRGTNICRPQSLPITEKEHCR
jgi:hypothetical protein